MNSTNLNHKHSDEEEIATEAALQSKPEFETRDKSNEMWGSEMIARFAMIFRNISEMSDEIEDTMADIGMLQVSYEDFEREIDGMFRLYDDLDNRVDCLEKRLNSLENCLTAHVR